MARDEKSREGLEFPTRCASGVPLILLGFVAIAAGLIKRNPGLLAFGCVFVSLPLVAYVLLRRSSRNLDYFRTAPAAAFEGDSVRVELTLHNGSDQSVFFPQVAEIFPPEIHAQKRVAFSGRLAPNESASQSYVGYCILPRGKYRLGPTAIRLTDALGWFEVKCAADAEQAFKVYPQIYSFPADEQLGRCLSWITQEQTTRGVGESEEFHTVREYRSGDSRRRIHWGLTARTGKPVVREFARTAVGDLTLVLDASNEGLVGWGRSSSTEYAVKIALAVASETLDRGHRARLVYGGPDGCIEFDATGPTDFKAILDAMVTLRPGDMKVPQPELIAGVDTVTGTVVIMIHPYLFGDEGLEQQLRRWTENGCRVLGVLFEGPRFHDMPRPDDSEMSAVHYATYLDTLRVRTKVVTCGDSIDTVFPGARRITRDNV